ncbi:MAG: hypothetical protein BGO14_00760 [Chlamydiales bacterium 38-26]|nr:hypothetical protein [Chlamydiales bacterium]OJV07253.1 MAG: hypothetical protein BGO14_00760 [Chlamydiales bacterium 38-26]
MISNQIYSSDGDFIYFSAPYNAKRLLNDSMSRTLDVYHALKRGAVGSGLGHLLLARIQSIVATAFVALSAGFITLGAVILSPCFLVPAVMLNLGSRLPKISSSQTVQEFTRRSSNVIGRMLKVHLISIPVLLLFLTTSSLNVLLPGVFQPKNLFLRTIHALVKPLGPLQTVRLTVPGKISVVGTKTKISALAAVEEFFRALSYKNYLKEEVVFQLTHYYRYTVMR